MDDRRFDTLTRSLASGTNRRRVLKGILGLGSAVVFVSETEAARRADPTPKPVSCPGQQAWDGTSCACPPGLDQCGPDCCPDGAECCDNACCYGACFGEELCCPTECVCVCGDACCGDGERCCDSEAGLSFCIPSYTCCRDSDCEGGSCVEGGCVPYTEPPEEPCGGPTVGSAPNVNGVGINGYGWVIPDGYDQRCLTGPGSGQRFSEMCPVLETCDATFWIYSDAQNALAFGVAKYDGSGALIDLIRVTGDRYIWQITVDPTSETVALWGQNTDTAPPLTLSFDQLGI